MRLRLAMRLAETLLDVIKEIVGGYREGKRRRAKKAGGKRK